MKPSDFHPGQTVYYPVRGWAGRDVGYVWRTVTNTVGKVGRKWITLAGGERLNPETMFLMERMDGEWFDCIERVFLSAEAVVEHLALKDAWERLRMVVSDNRDHPEGLMADQVEAWVTAIKEAS